VTTLLLSAGNATRLGDAAPGGCKALTPVGGKTMLGWWLDIDPGLTLICRTEHVPQLYSGLVEVFTCDDGGGPAKAVAKALPYCDGPITVAYADTWVAVNSMPLGVDWCGVAAAAGGRNWDVLEDGLMAYRHVEAGDVALVGIGLYRFADVDRLGKALDEAIDMANELGNAEAGMADVVNIYGCSFRPVLGWQDVGDAHALAAWRRLS
jgi:hypothetical protein